MVAPSDINVHCFNFFPLVLKVSTSDYLLPNSTLTFPAGSTNGSTVQLPFTIVDDKALEGSHIFSVGLVSVEAPAGPNSLLTIGSPSTADVIIEDNERMFILQSTSCI